jgi:hypothetical protein
MDEGWDKKKKKPKISSVVEIKEVSREKLVKCDLCKGRGLIGEHKVLEVKQDASELSDKMGIDSKSKSTKRREMLCDNTGAENAKWCDVSHNSLEMLNTLVKDLDENREISKPQLLWRLANGFKTKWKIFDVKIFDSSMIKKNNQIQFVKVDKNNESQLFSFKKGPKRNKSLKSLKNSISSKVTLGVSSKEAEMVQNITQNNMQKILEIKKVVEPLYEHDSKQVPDNLTDFLDFLKNVFIDITIKVNNKMGLTGEAQVQVSGTKKPKAKEYMIKTEDHQKKFPQKARSSETENALIEQTSGFKQNGKSIQVKQNTEMSAIARENLPKYNEKIIEKYESFQRYIHFLENQILQHKTEKMYLETQINDLNKKVNMVNIKNQNLGNENHLLLIRLENKTLKSNMLENFLHDCSNQLPEFENKYFKYKASLRGVFTQKELSMSLLRQKLNEHANQHNFHTRRNPILKEEYKHEESIMHKRKQEQELKRSFTSFADGKDYENPQFLREVDKAGKCNEERPSQITKKEEGKVLMEEGLIPKRNKMEVVGKVQKKEHMKMGSNKNRKQGPETVYQDKMVN